MIPIELGDVVSMLIPAMYSSCAMKAREMKKVKKLRYKNIVVAQIVDRWRQN